jgi:hypothetical protein
MDKGKEITLDELYSRIADLKDDVNFNFGMALTFLGELEASKSYQKLAKTRLLEMDELFAKQAELLERAGA